MGVWGKVSQQKYRNVSIDSNNCLLNFTCPFYRPSQWRETDQCSISICVDRAKRETHLQYDVVIWFDNRMTIEDLQTTLTSIQDITPIPNKVFIVNNNSIIKPSNLITLMANFKLPWQIETFTQKMRISRGLNLITQKTNSIFVFYCLAGYSPSKAMFNKLDKYLYDDLQRLLMLLPTDSINNMMVMRHLWKLLGPTHVLEKARTLQREKPCLIQSAQEWV
jgi:hypothetical protein